MSAEDRVLIADDEPSLRLILRELLTREGCQVEEAEDGQQALEMARAGGYDLYLLDMKMPRRDGLDALREIRALYPDALAVMITAYGSQMHAVQALKTGAYDYFTKPFHLEELRIILTRALDKQRLLRKLHQLQEELSGQGRGGGGGIIGKAPAMRQVFDLIDRVAEHDVTVLITGESGTGKELVAQAIHESSSRAGGPFIKVNCAAIPEPLLESELFGHEKGAFTGALCAKPGKFESADGGTILLDEIGEMPVSLQSKLLRVLQERLIERVGGTAPRPVNIRVIAATNRDLTAMVREKSFREDLFFRLNVVPIHLPALRQRKEDLAALVQHFLSLFNTRFGKRIQGLSAAAMACVERYDWPGNIRELENTIQRAIVLTRGLEIDVDALPNVIAEYRNHNNTHEGNGVPVIGWGGGGNGNGNGDGKNRGLSQNDCNSGISGIAEDFTRPLALRIEEIIEVEERRIIQCALERVGGHREKTADLLGISRKSLHNKMAKYDLFTRDEAQARE